jgi:hypothetical protein
MRLSQRRAARRGTMLTYHVDQDEAAELALLRAEMQYARALLLACHRPLEVRRSWVQRAVSEYDRFVTQRYASSHAFDGAREESLRTG